MRIAIVAATDQEMIAAEQLQSGQQHQFEFHVLGIGLVSATFHLTKIALSKPDLIIMIGIAGSYSNKLEMGDVVFVRSESIGDLGVENNHEWISFSQLNLEQFHYDFDNPLKNTFGCKEAKGISVNTCAGNLTTINQRIKLFNPDIETMEGAALHYVCLQTQIPFIQLRGISNKVEIRNRENWKIPLAIQNCHQTLNLILSQLILLS